MKKILFSVVGIGLGHATRSLAIINELKKHKNVKLKITTWSAAYDFYKKMKLPCEDIGGYDYKGDYTFSAMMSILDSFKDPTKLHRDYSNFKRVANSFKPDVIFTDTDPNAFYYAYRRGIPNYMLSNLTTTIDNYEKIPKEYRTRDLMVQNFMVNRMMNFIKSKSKTIFTPSYETKVRFSENVKYTDLIVRQKPDELSSEEALRKKLKIKNDFYLVTSGGSEIEKYIFRIFLKVLPAFKDKKFIISSNYQFKSKVQKGNMTILPFIPNMLEYLKVSKGILSPAGHTTISEAIVYKKPVGAIPLVNHIEQMVNGALLNQTGMGTSCFLKKKPDPKVIENFMQNFFDEEEKTAKTLQKYKFKGDGAAQIASHLSKEY